MRRLAVALSVLLSFSAVAQADEGRVDFNRDIRPILSNNCFTCHGPDEGQRANDLRLDRPEGMTAKLESGVTAVVPGKPDESELVARVTTDDPDLRMPPPDSKKHLTPNEIELLRRWVEQGAVYAAHWSYAKPVRPAVPVVGGAGRVRNPIDAFVLARLQQEDLSPAAEADPYTLVRRVYLDLTGLPPNPAQADEFVADSSPGAYERLVDRLLADPAYGEHRARKWLDLARYADSAGYADDPARTIWAYRDYVIRAMNDNRPFDAFTMEQIAGDLLPSPTDEQLVATAFHRNTLTNNEGGTNDEEFRNVAVVDRVNTTMAVWMGTTAACAQCHTHKYDPITQTEYFRLFAFFNNTEDADRTNESPLLSIWTDGQKKQRAAWEAELASLKQQLAAETPELRAAQGKWEAELAAAPSSSVTGRTVRVEIPDREEYLSLAEVQVFSGSENVAPAGTATQSSTAYEGRPERAIDGRTDGDFGANSTTHTGGEKGPWWQVDLGKDVPIDRVLLWNRTDGNVGGRLKGAKVSILDAAGQAVWVGNVDKAPAPSLELPTAAAPGDVIAAAKTPVESRTAEQTTRLASYFRSITPLLADTRGRIAAVEKGLADLKPMTTVPVMRELGGNDRRVTKLHHRGNWMDLGDEVTPGVPEAFPPLPSGMAADRIALAQWLLDAQNPLTARVAVNRVWEELFGTGIVRTSEEFGSQGEPPSHPELLDWLAVEFRESGWDTKGLLRLIVTSATYRQDAAAPAELHERDPENRLLARGPRFRLPAEGVRDQALAAAGLLGRSMYGEPVRPPQPSLGLAAAFGSSTDWKTSDGEDRYRRGLYTTWRRSNPYPSMATFDAPNREVCTLRRPRTNTPLQALVTLNDPVYVEAAQGLARRIVSAGGSPADKATFGLRSCVTRPATETEVAAVVKLYEDAKAEYAADPDAAKRMATDPLGPLPEGADVVEYAAWTVIANVLLNLDETLAKP